MNMCMILKAIVDLIINMNQCLVLLYTSRSCWYILKDRTDPIIIFKEMSAASVNSITPSASIPVWNIFMRILLASIFFAVYFLSMLLLSLKIFSINVRFFRNELS